MNIIPTILEKTNNECIAYDLYSRLFTTISHITDGACDVAISLARANGEELNKNYFCFLPIKPGETCQGYLVVTCRDNYNGVTGMDVEGVKNALAIFKTSILACIEKFDNIPNGIAFYDPDGNIVGEYNRGIQNFKSEISDLAGDIYQEINRYISTEADNILLAKQNATQTLNG